MYTYENFIGIIPTPTPTFVGGKQNLGETLFMGFLNCFKKIIQKTPHISKSTNPSKASSG